MDEVETWHGGSTRPRPHCVEWRVGDPGPLPQKEHSPQFLAHVCCYQTDGWIKTPLGTEVGLGPGHIVRWGPSPPKGHIPSIFDPYMSVVTKWLDGSRCHLVRRFMPNRLTTPYQLVLLLARQSSPSSSRRLFSQSTGDFSTPPVDWEISSTLTIANSLPQKCAPEAEPQMRGKGDKRWARLAVNLVCLNLHPELEW